MIGVGVFTEFTLSIDRYSPLTMISSRSSALAVRLVNAVVQRAAVMIVVM